jgi:hypothetical protein
MNAHVAAVFLFAIACPGCNRGQSAADSQILPTTSLARETVRRVASFFVNRPQIPRVVERYYRLAT